MTASDSGSVTTTSDCAWRSAGWHRDCLRSRCSRPSMAWELASGKTFVVDTVSVASIVFVCVFPSLLGYLFLNRGVGIYAMRRIEIGDHTRIGDLATIHDSDVHEVEPGRPIRVEPVTIGRNVWIGSWNSPP